MEKTWSEMDADSTSRGKSDSADQSGVIYNTLRAQNLSHIAFHSGLKRNLGQMWKAINRSTRHDRVTAAIVGVEYGAEALELGKLGYNLLLFEPNKEFARSTAKSLSEENLNYQMHNIALSDIRKEGTVEYGGSSHAANFALLDDFVNESISILSLDTQGNEYDILQGSSKIFRSKSVTVEMLWIEISTLICYEKLTKLLQLVDTTHIIMDFVWWGKPKSKSNEEFNTDLSNQAHFIIYEGVQSIDSFVNLFCQQQETFSWLQTDLLAIDRRLISPKIMENLNEISLQCWKDFDCPLRKMP